MSSIKISLFPAASRTPICLGGSSANLVSGGIFHPKPRFPIRERSSLAAAPLCETALLLESWGIRRLPPNCDWKLSEDESRWLCRLHRCSLRNDAILGETPQRDQQLSRQREPGKVHDERPQPPVAVLADALLALHAAACKRRSRQPRIGPKRTSIGEVAAESLSHQERRALGTMLFDLYRSKFGDYLPMIRRQDVKGFVKRKPLWLTRSLGLDEVRKYAETMELEWTRFYHKAAQSAHDTSIRELLDKLAGEARPQVPARARDWCRSLPGVSKTCS